VREREDREARRKNYAEAIKAEQAVAKKTIVKPMAAKRWLRDASRRI
jgi:hypothetical protein